MYEVGRTGRVMANADNPLSKGEALEGAKTITKNGWRCWVEHHKSKKRCFENELEIARRRDVEARLIDTRLRRTGNYIFRDENDC